MLTFSLGDPCRSHLCSHIRYGSNSCNLSHSVNVLQMKGINVSSILFLCYFGTEHHTFSKCVKIWTQQSHLSLRSLNFCLSRFKVKYCPWVYVFLTKAGILISHPRSPGNINRAGLGLRIRNKEQTGSLFPASLSPREQASMASDKCV